MMPTKNLFALKILFAGLCLVMLALQLRSMSTWTESRAVYDDICYLRQAHLFQRFGLKGFDTDISRDDDGYFRSKLREIGFPDWKDATVLPCHNPMPATGKTVIQYPPGVGMVLALFPAGHQVVPMFMLSTIAIFAVALLAIFRAQTRGLIVTAGLFGCLAVYIMINPIKASYSMAPTAVVCALSGYLVARWLMSSRQDTRIAPLIALGLLLGFAVDLRLANLFLASGYCFFLLFAFLRSRKPRQFLEGAVFAVALVVGMVPIIISQAVNTGNPFISTYSGAPDVKPLDFSLTAIEGYLNDTFQSALLALAIAGTVWLWRSGDERTARVARVTALNLAVNLAFFLTYPIATPYYIVPIALLSLWSVLFASVMREAAPSEAVARQPQVA
jgi:hypothetical protein